MKHFIQSSVIMSHISARKIIHGTVKVLHIKLTILAFIFLPIAVFTLITSKTDRIGGIKSLVVLTGSMTPSIPQGSVIFIKSAEAYSMGDVVTFEQKGRLVTHRIEAIENMNGDTFFATKGDANNSADSDLVASNLVQGRTLFHIPAFGKAILFFKTPVGFVLSIILPTLLFIGFELWAIKNEIVKNTEERIRKSQENIFASQVTNG